MSWTSTETYYRLLNTGVAERLGGLHSARLVLHSVDFDEIATLQHAGDWDATAEILADAARGWRAAGAEGAPARHQHHAQGRRRGRARPPGCRCCTSPTATAAAVRAAGLSRSGCSPRRSRWRSTFYVDRLAAARGRGVVPEAGRRAEVHRIIYDELVRDVVRAELAGSATAR